jgi:hypothetical protein
MQRLILFAAVLLSAALPAHAQVKAVVTGPKQASLGDLVVLDGSQSQAQKFKWAAVGHSKSFLPVDGGIRLVFASGAPGEYIFALVAAGTNVNGGAEADVALWTVTVGTPAPPTPPTPVEPPAPPTPPAPIPAAGLWVLIVEESGSRDKLPPGQREIILGTGAGSVREYLTGHCAKEGTQQTFRVLDKDDSIDRESSTWREVWARPRASVPWLVISNGKEGYEGPLPATAADCLTLLRKFGGQ